MYQEFKFKTVQNSKSTNSIFQCHYQNLFDLWVLCLVGFQTLTSETQYLPQNYAP